MEHYLSTKPYETAYLEKVIRDRMYYYIIRSFIIYYIIIDIPVLGIS